MMWKKTWKIWAVCMMLLLCISGVTVFASGSDDNSLSDLGIENATSISPDFEYSTTEYEVEVPEGTTELQLSPVTSDGAATCEVSGQTLTDGKTTVYITVTSESGMQQPRKQKRHRQKQKRRQKPFLMRQMPCSRK